MAAWNETGGIKIDRAKEIYTALEEEFRAFEATKPYQIVVTEEPGTGDLVLTAAVRQHPPKRWGAMAEEVAHHLRSALNILYGAAFGVPADQDCNFPIDLSIQDWEKRYARIVRSSRRPVRDALKAVRAYPGGNNPICHIRAITNEGKHRSLVPVFAKKGYSIMQVTLTTVPRPIPRDPKDFPVRQAKLVYPVEDGTEIARYVGYATRIAGAAVDVSTNGPLDIVFGRPTSVQGQSLLSTLSDCGRAVEEVVESFRPWLPRT